MIFAIGSNGNGQLALGHQDDIHIPAPCLTNYDFPNNSPKVLVAGGNHTFILFPCGKLFATGLNEQGQCGIPVSRGKSFDKFHPVPAPPEDNNAAWSLVSAGWDFSILVSRNGNVYSCGFGSKGELGLGEKLKSPEIAKINDFPPISENRVVSISSGMAHTIVVLENGDIYGWGAGRKGQLGAPSLNIISSPRKIQVDFPVAQAVCGREFGFVMSSDGNSHAVLGGDKYSIKTSAPDQGDLKNYKKVCASWGGIYVLLENNTIKTWGRNDKGQVPPDTLTGVEEMAVGSEHGVALIRMGASPGELRAVAWGWGEHGNCGKSREDNGGDVIGDVHEVSVKKHLILAGVGAGCATSWFWTQ